MGGFVYIWRDRKHKRYYIGSHWGTPDDGYICSSSWMNNSFKRRPTDFKRRILSVIITSKQDLLDEEFRYLNQIKEHELGKQYYNLTNRPRNQWWADPDRCLTIGQKITKN